MKSSIPPSSYLQSNISSVLFIHTSSLTYFPVRYLLFPKPQSISTLTYLQLPISPCQSINFPLVSRMKGSGEARRRIFPLIIKIPRPLPISLLSYTKTCMRIIRTYTQTSPKNPTPDTVTPRNGWSAQTMQ